MLTRVRNLHPLGLVAVGVVATLVLSGTAIAVTDTTFTYSTAKTGYFTVSGLALAPRDTASANSGYSAWADGTLSTPAYACFGTGVNLPHNAKVTTMQTFYRSTSSEGDVILSRTNPSSGAGDYLVGQAITDIDGLRKSVTGTVPLAQRTVWNNAGD